MHPKGDPNGVLLGYEIKVRNLDFDRVCAYVCERERCGVGRGGMGTGIGICPLLKYNCSVLVYLLINSTIFIDFDWLNQSLESFKIKCKLTFLK